MNIYGIQQEYLFICCYGYEMCHFAFQEVVFENRSCRNIFQG